MGAQERDLIRERLLNLKPEERLFRINAGMGYVAPPGQMFKATKPMTVKIMPGDVLLRHGLPFHAAPEGWPDLVGWRMVTVTPDMIGKPVAVFLAEEVKATGRLSKAQRRFKEIVERMGGLWRTVKPSPS